MEEITNVPAVYQPYSVLATVPPAQAITLLASQLPVFYGSENDDMNR